MNTSVRKPPWSREGDYDDDKKRVKPERERLRLSERRLGWCCFLVAATDCKHGNKAQDSRTGEYPIAPKRQTKSLAEQCKPQECDTEIQQRGLQLGLSHRPNETQDQPPLARASVACNGGIFIKWSEVVRRSAVGSSDWLDVGCSFKSEVMNGSINGNSDYHKPSCTFLTLKSTSRPAASNPQKASMPTRKGTPW